MATHVLKTDTEVFQEAWDEVKPFELRLDDRNYKIGDNLILVETLYPGIGMQKGKPLEYTGRWLSEQVLCKLKEKYGLKKGWCILGTKLIVRREYLPESPEFAATLKWA